MFHTSDLLLLQLQILLPLHLLQLAFTQLLVLLNTTAAVTAATDTATDTATVLLRLQRRRQMMVAGADNRHKISLELARPSATLSVKMKFVQAVLSFAAPLRFSAYGRTVCRCIVVAQ